MNTVALEYVERAWCDVCGKDITHSSSASKLGKDFCISTRHEILGKQLECRDLYKIKIQIEQLEFNLRLKK